MLLSLQKLFSWSMSFS